MGHRFDITKRTHKSDAIVLFIDLLGTSALWENALAVENQAERILWTLLGKFDIVFSDNFNEKEIVNSFDISIFTDTIVISQRLKLPNIVERLVNFATNYHVQLHHNNIASQAIIVKDSFFSIKLNNVSKESILGSNYTSVSLCGGKGLISAHNRLKGMPIGVYLDSSLKSSLSQEQDKMLVLIKEDINTLFLKCKTNIYELLPEETLNLLLKRSGASNKDIKSSLVASGMGEDKIKKYLPWLLVHLRDNKIMSKNLGLTTG
jgi:hypothetical protein